MGAGKASSIENFALGSENGHISKTWVIERLCLFFLFFFVYLFVLNQKERQKRRVWARLLKEVCREGRLDPSEGLPEDWLLP